jgi:hypothetical protein
MAAVLELTDEQKQEIVDAAVAEIRERAKQQAVSGLTGYVQSAVQSAMWEEITAMVRAEVVPAVREHLLLNKAVLIEAATLAAGDMAVAIREAMLKKLTDKLSTEWERNKIVEALFK